MPKEKSRVFIALGTSLLKWHAILGRGVFFVNTPRWTRVNSLSKVAEWCKAPTDLRARQGGEFETRWDKL